METAAKRLALRIMGQALAGRRPKTFTTALGDIELERAWYHCQPCRTGFSPRDRALGLEGTSLSPAAVRMTGLTAARVSFAETGELLRELAGLDIDPKLAERQAETLGREIADDERQVIEPEPAQARTLYLGLDGTGVPMRKAETQHRQGKQPNGSAKTREAKIVTVWSAETTAPDGSPVRDPGSVSYNAAIETVASRDTNSEPSPFARRAVREALRRSFHHAPRQVVLGDGAPWIWNWADEHLPNAIQIVDVFHAKGHLVQVANAIYGAATDLALSWGKQRRDDLDQGRIDRRLAALHDHAHTCDEARKCIDSFTRNRQRIRYPAFRAMGLCVSTGVVEAACKNIVGTRLKRGGMHGSLNGANAILALRCAILSNRFLDFWERRAYAK